MRTPLKKEIHKLSPEIVFNVYHAGIKHVYEGKLFNKPRPCPKCNSENIIKRGIKEKIFCRLITLDGFDDIKVHVQRFGCKDCGHVYLADGFYSNCSYGSALIDFCLFLSAKNPYHKCEVILANMFGLQVDRDTIRNYALRFEDRVKKIAGIKLFGDDIAINFLKLFFNVNNVKELKKKYNKKTIESAGDETYPAIKGAKKKLRMENKERKRRDEKEKKYPDSFTTGLSYLPKLKCYSSLLVTRFPFNSMFAEALMRPTEGTDYNLTDGHGAYNDFRDVYDLFHKFKNECKKNKHLKKLQKNGSTKEVREYLSSKYRQKERHLVEKLKKKYPDFVDPGGNFTGAITTNCIEGGNWRVKYELRVPYSDENSFTARTVLICILDSMKTFRNGRPEESFTHANSSFTFRDVMSIEYKEEKIKLRFDLPQPEFNPLSIRRMVI